MSKPQRVISFPFRRSLRVQRKRAVRLVAAALLILFSAAVLWTTIVSAGSFSLTTGCIGPIRAFAPGR